MTNERRSRLSRWGLSSRRAVLAALLLLAWASGCEAPAGGAEAAAEAGADAGAVVREAFISLASGAPASVLWDDARSVLHVVDNTGNRLWTWSDAAGLGSSSPVALPLPPDAGSLAPNVTLGQAALTADGTLVVTRFGQPGGGMGGIAYVKADGTTGTVPNLDGARRRLGLATAPDGRLYGSFFTSVDGGVTGSLTTVDLQAGETVVAEGFGKIVGLAITGGRLFVSDQSSAKVFDAPLTALPAHAADWHTLATLVKPDQICPGPDGSLFTGQFQGAPGSSDPIAVRSISASGVVTPFKADPEVSKPSGVSYDASGRRLFVADSGNSAKLGVHVFPVP